ncbi:S-adenosylmethionine synthetase N-terminal domain-containing protein [Streptomyces bambusae]|nr:S-adenosylmethionine synthetase N-terminal domain-containing protein [Streptomyces bambusae]MCB5167428.1 S-adenosylmethionine synthetase N-terminal domain-containing protein [Streptomyces bambusae]
MPRRLFTSESVTEDHPDDPAHRTGDTVPGTDLPARPTDRR